MSEEKRIKKSLTDMKDEELKKLALKSEKIEHTEKEIAMIKENFDEQLRKKLDEMEQKYNKQLKEVLFCSIWQNFLGRPYAEAALWYRAR